MDVTLSVTKSAVMNEVAKQTSYIGAKTVTPDGGNAYDQVFSTDDDYAMLERYWREAVDAVTGNLRKFIKTISDMPAPQSVDTEEVFTVVLDMPARYDTNQNGTVNTALFSYFTHMITSKWLAVVHKEDAAYYEKIATEKMREILFKIYYKKPAKRT